MRIAFIILLALHGGIHLFGFLKAFGIVEFKAIGQPITRTLGVFWLITFVLYSILVIQLIIRSDFWWIIGILALIFSQILILFHWSDTRFGSIVNLIILLVTIVGYSSSTFKNKIIKERVEMLKASETGQDRVAHLDDIDGLPPIVQKWLASSGVIGLPEISTVYLTQELEMKLKPDQAVWYAGYAEQYFTIQKPAFNWNMTAQMNPALNVVGRDKFEDGEGEMLIKLWSLISVADVKNEEKVNQASLQRFLAEIVWFPSASLSPYIEWETIDDNSARATMTYNGTKGSGVFFFDEDGAFKKFVAMRFKDKEDIVPIEWIVTATKTEKRNGIRIPVECEVSWMVENEPWTWLRLKIKSIAYNAGEISEEEGV